MKKTMRILSLILAIAMMVCCFTACGDKKADESTAADDSKAEASSDAAAGDNVLELGSIGPLTGDYAVYGDRDSRLRDHPEYRDEAGYRRNR